MPELRLQGVLMLSSEGVIALVGAMVLILYWVLRCGYGWPFDKYVEER